jgi:DNA-directed RNA polymerase specialized sigma24 family protein
MDESQTGGTSLLLLESFRRCDDTAAEALFVRYFARLTALARSRLSARVARRTDPADVVLSVYRSFFIGARSGRYVVTRGGDLWRLLASMTKHKVLRQLRYHDASRRSVSRELPLDSVLESQSVEREPDPGDVVALADMVEHVLSKLDPFGRRVMELRLQGAQIAEIAEDTARSERSVRRALNEIRALLAKRLDHE